MKRVIFFLMVASILLVGCKPTAIPKAQPRLTLVSIQTPGLPSRQARS